MAKPRESMYYVLDAEIPMDENDGYLDIDDSMVEIDGIDSWSVGKKFTVPVPTPIIVDATPIEEYAGPPPEMNDANILIMSTRLVKALREAGVDNIDTYPALLRNTETGKTHPYEAVNIIGLVAAADLAKSEWESFDAKPQFDTTFERLVIDPDAAGGSLMFRLAENTFAIVVHARVRDHLVKSGLDTLTFAEPEDWAHF
jgi:hypothetical protein